MGVEQNRINRSNRTMRFHTSRHKVPLQPLRKNSGALTQIKIPFAYMPSAFAYLPPASHALWFIACYQQFTIMMFFTSLLISLPYSSVRVTSGDGNSLIFTKTFYIMLRSLWIVRPGPSFFSPIIGRIPLKSVNSFIFVFSRWCKNSTRVKTRL